MSRHDAPFLLAPRSDTRVLRRKQFKSDYAFLSETQADTRRIKPAGTELSILVARSSKNFAATLGSQKLTRRFRVRPGLHRNHAGLESPRRLERSRNETQGRKKEPCK